MKFEQATWKSRAHPLHKIFLNDNSMKNTNFYYLLGWIIDQNLPFSNGGFVKLSKVKSIKVMKICDDIMTLTLTPLRALGEVLLSHNTYHKTGCNTIVDDLLKLGYGISCSGVHFRRINGQNRAPINLQF